MVRSGARNSDGRNPAKRANTGAAVASSRLGKFYDNIYSNDCNSLLKDDLFWILISPAKIIYFNIPLQNPHFLRHTSKNVLLLVKILFSWGVINSRGRFGLLGKVLWRGECSSLQGYIWEEINISTRLWKLRLCRGIYVNV